MNAIPLSPAQRGLFFAQELDPGTPAYTTAELVEFDGPLDVEVLAAALERAYAEFEQLRVSVHTSAAEAGVEASAEADAACEAEEAGGEQGPVQVLHPAGPALEIVEDEDPRAWLETALDTPFDLGTGPVVRTALLREDGRSLWFHATHHVAIDGFGFMVFARRVAALYTEIAQGAGTDSTGPDSQAHPATPSRAKRPTPALAELVAEARALEAAEASADAEFWNPRLDRMTESSSIAGRIATPARHAQRHTIDVSADTQQALLRAGRALGTPWTTIAEAAFSTYLWRFLAPSSEAEVPAVRIGIPHLNRFRPGRGRLARAGAVCTAMNVLPLSLAGTAEALTVGGAVEALVAEHSAVAGHTEARQEDLTRSLARSGAGQLFGPQVNLLPFESALHFGAAAGTIRNLTAGPVEDMTWCLRGALGRGTVRLEIDVNPDLYPAGSAAAHAGRLAAWLRTFAEAAGSGAEIASAATGKAADAATGSPTTRIVDLELMDAADRARMAEWTGAHREYPRRTLPQAFVEQAGRTPEAPALIWDDATGRTHSWTYAELLDRAGALARTLRELHEQSTSHEHSDARDDLGPWTVGVALPRGPELFAALYATQLAGAAYVPLDPDQPAARLADMVADARVTLAFATAETRDLLPAGVTVLDPVSRETRLSDGAPETPGAPEAWWAGAEDPAYVLFTSGSTGRPKGVVVGQAAIDNRLEWMQELYPLHPGDHVAHKTPISFDVSLWELFWPLRVGAAIVITAPGAHRDPRALATTFRRHRVDTVHFVPSMLHAFLSDSVALAELGDTPALRRIFCSGEALPGTLVQASARGLGIAPINLYGPTEAAVDVTHWDCDPAVDLADVPIGRPVPNVRCHVLDPAGRPCPAGMTGELVLAGVQVAEGYIGRPEATAKAFLAEPAELRGAASAPGDTEPSAEPGGMRPAPPAHTRMYRTGDRALWREDGVLLYRGRLDDQVKVRGQRVEPGEIRAVLARVPGVDNLEILAVTGSGETRLICYYSLAEAAAGSANGTGTTSVGTSPAHSTAVPGTPSPDPATVRAALQAAALAELPAAMRPSAYGLVEHWPLTVSGKTDRRALSALPAEVVGASGQGTAGPGARAAGNLLEQEIARVMGEILQTVTPRPDEDFFALGGSSLTALRLLTAVEAIAGHRANLADVFAAPTARTLAARLTPDAAASRQSGPGAGTDFGDPLGAVFRLRAGDADQVPLVALPPAGGLGWCWAGLLRHLPADRPIYVIQVEGMNTGSPVEHPDLHSWAQRIAKLLEPVTGTTGVDLLGWSIGGMLAQELAVTLDAAGRTVRSVTLLDAYPAEQWAKQPLPDERETLIGLLRMAGLEPAEGEALDHDSVLAHLAADGSTFAGLQPQVISACMHNVRASARMIHASAHRTWQGDLRFFASADSLAQGFDPAGWAAHATGAIEVTTLPVHHGLMVREPAIAQVAQWLRHMAERPAELTGGLPFPVGR
ncbi:amino acid adenylation domain-containing protein [Brevibacterium sp. 91QC2O2]|uniref:amino acid adenylation domain-containing protein n=1 Tax=Brevibacterium sp. 91QC2O2 TaxID=2968458 RepID=UPI00211BABDB|nr:amino acid adenylation domain-containing protein [Brevibacterium sp. 91QC2O2]MCQ9369265.1 amino acid adenylation domain-containing protein [Brevibacterium sp. 91QC2O2]